MLTTLVAVVDNGFNVNDSRLEGMLVPGYNMATGTSDVSGEFEGHGTQVAVDVAAAILAAESLSGVDLDIKILPIKAVGQHTGAIRYAADRGVAAINYSFATNEKWYEMLSAISYAGVPSRDASFVTAPGQNGYSNDGERDLNQKPLYPASFNEFDPIYDTSNMLVVTSADESGVRFPANYGSKHVDVGLNLGGDRYETSYAAGQASGLVGVIAALRPDWTDTQRVNHIKQTGQVVAALAGVTKTGRIISPANAVSGIVPDVTAASVSSSQIALN